MLGVSALAFSLGMYLPIELNSPILIGACVGWLIQKSSKDEVVSKARSDKSILIASGFIAGGALAGVFDGITKMVLSEGLGIDPETFGFHHWFAGIFTEGFRNWVGLLVFCALAAFLFWDARRAKADA
jgi:hypothetical protein